MGHTLIQGGPKVIVNMTIFGILNDLMMSKIKTFICKHECERFFSNKFNIKYFQVPFFEKVNNFCMNFRPGPWVEATKGEIWPKPKVQKSQPEFFSLRSSSFAFEVSQ